MLIKEYFSNIKKNHLNHKFSGISFNSNEIKKGYIFFAIKGNKIDGKKYINQAINNGAKTIISDLKFQGYKTDVLFLNSKNPRKLLSETANKLYNKKPKNLIAVTGTNGKSSVANFFFQILKLNKKKVASIGTLGVNSNNSNLNTNNTTLDPIRLNKILENHKNNNIDNVILEASSHGLKQHRLDGLKFNIGIFTNLSRDHLDYHKSFENYLKSKMILFNKLMNKSSKIIYDTDILQSKILKSISTKKKLNPITIGKKNSDLKIINHRFVGNEQETKFTFNNNTYSFKTGLIGRIQIKNLVMAIIAANKSNLPMKKIIKSIDKIKPVNGRLEKVGNIKNNSKVILDYAHTPDALKTCLTNLREQFKLSKVSIVFGCGGERDKPKRQIMGKIVNDLCDRIYLTDDNPRKENPKKIRTQIKKKISKFKLVEIPSREIAISKAIKNLNSGDILLVAGKGHENYQEYFKKNFFSDKKCIIKNIQYKNKILLKNWKLNIIKEKLKKIKLSNNQKINLASINSKEIKKNDIFFGIKGKKLDGNRYANEAIKNGAALAIIDKNYGGFNSKKIKVNNTLNFLSNCSNLVRKASKIKAIAITGSSGKTSLKELLSQCLNKIASTSYSKKSFNNKFGVPISLFNIQKNNIFGVFEVGMDKKGEINHLTKLIMPDLGVITNISYAHIKNFKNLYEIALAKSEMINNIVSGGSIVLNKDDKFFNFLKNKALKKKLKVISFSEKNNADIRMIKITRKKSNYLLILKISNNIKKFIIKESLKFYIVNILATIAVISNYIDVQSLKENFFYSFKIPKGRGDFSKIKLNNKSINIVDESYNSNPLSLEFAINNFNKMNVSSKSKNILLGDMLELGKFSKNLHREAAKIVNKSKINKVFVYGKDIKETFNKIKTQKKGRILNSKKEIISLMKNDLRDNDYLMVKASNATGLNNVISQIKLGQLNVI